MERTRPRARARRAGRAGAAGDAFAATGGSCRSSRRRHRHWTRCWPLDAAIEAHLPRPWRSRPFATAAARARAGSGGPPSHPGPAHVDVAVTELRPLLEELLDLVRSRLPTPTERSRIWPSLVGVAISAGSSYSSCVTWTWARCAATSRRRTCCRSLACWSRPDLSIRAVRWRILLRSASGDPLRWRGGMARDRHRLHGQQRAPLPGRRADPALRDHPLGRGPIHVRALLDRGRADLRRADDHRAAHLRVA